MKRLPITLLAAAALTLSIVGSVSAEEGVVYKFPCADITDGSGGLILNESTGRYDFGFNLTTPSRCGGMVYTLYIFDSEAACVAARNADDTSSAIAAIVVRGADATSEATGQVVFLADSLSADTSTGVFATTSKGKAIYDVAPDPGEGCVEVAVDSPASGKFR